MICKVVAGIDIREHGSGNAGTTNTLRILGKKAGVIVLAGDILKTILAITVSRLLFGDSKPEMIYLLSLYAATGAILGHNFPFYLKFKGGKAVATTLGVFLVLVPYAILILLVVFFVIFALASCISKNSVFGLISQDIGFAPVAEIA